MIVSAYGHYLITCTIYASQYLLSFKTFREGMYKCDSNSNEHAPPLDRNTITITTQASKLLQQIDLIQEASASNTARS